MLQINGKTFMNLQEAVQWLLDNNALPFQSSANYVANTEIGMGTIVNPSPAKVRIGSLIFFADSKVSTVTGLTENGFIVSDQYNDLVDDVVYVSNVALNASGHLIVTLSNGDNIDAGLVKQVSSFSINGSQHLIANYNDGTSTDLGAIFSGNVTISGNLVANTISQQNPNYNQSFSLSSYHTFITLTEIYNRLEIINNVLYLVVSIKGEVNDGQTHDITSLAYNQKALPSDISSKIYDIEGHTVSETIGSTANILRVPCVVYVENVGTVDAVMVFDNATTANYVTCTIVTKSTLSLATNGKFTISARTFLTLL